MTRIKFSNYKKASSVGWCLFDFANSIPAVIGGVYFSKWFIDDKGASSIVFNLLFFISAAFLILVGKWVGKKIDTSGYKFWIKLSSFITFLALLSLFLCSQFMHSQYLILFSFIFFSVFIFGYQVSRISHNVYLKTIIPELIQSKMSGYGAAANWAGSIVGLIITIPIVSIYPNSFGRELTFLVAVVCYAILTPVSIFLMFKSEGNIAQDYFEKKETISWKSLLTSFGLILFVYFLLFDVMSTVERNLPPYLTEIFKMPDTTQAIGFLTILCAAMIGGFISSRMVSKMNSTFWLKTCSFFLAFAIILITTQNDIFLWLSFVIAGICYGILESAIRINFMNRFPAETSGENFGVLAIVERTSGIGGPLVWIIPFALFSNDTYSYTWAMFLMAGISFIAFILLFKFKNILPKNN